MKEMILVAKIDQRDEVILQHIYEFFKEENIDYQKELEEQWIGARPPRYVKL